MMRSVVLMFALAFSGIACATTRRAPAESFVLDIVNENFYAARVHATWDGANRRPLGTIDGNGGRTRATVAWQPRALAFEIQLVTEGSSWLSLPVDVSPGDSIELRIPSNLRESGFFRRMPR